MKYFLVFSLISLLEAIEIPVNFTEFIIGNRQFTGRLYTEFVKNRKDNFILSPYSIQTIFALTQHGSRGATKQEILDGVNLPKSDDLIREIYLYLNENQLSNNDGFNLTIINKIYVKYNFKIDQQFIDTAVKFYQSSIENIDFLPNDLAAKQINEWIEEQTNYRIKNLINPDSLTRDTVLILLNTLYFQGRWLNRFHRELTKLRKFYKGINETVEIDTIQTIDLYNYYECKKLDVKFIELPYLVINASMIIVLPNQINGLEQLEQSINTIIENPPKYWSQERVNLTLPRFHIDNKIDLVDVLKSLGVRKVFNEDADLNGLGTGQGHLCVDKVLQSTFINIDEDGTEAATSTAVIGQDRIGLISDDPTVTFNADHPFIFYIKINEIIYFIGRYLL